MLANLLRYANLYLYAFCVVVWLRALAWSNSLHESCHIYIGGHMNMTEEACGGSVACLTLQKQLFQKVNAAT